MPIRQLFVFVLALLTASFATSSTPAWLEEYNVRVASRIYEHAFGVYRYQPGLIYALRRSSHPDAKALREALSRAQRDRRLFKDLLLQRDHLIAIAVKNYSRFDSNGHPRMSLGAFVEKKLRNGILDSSHPQVGLLDSKTMAGVINSYTEGKSFSQIGSVDEDEVRIDPALERLLIAIRVNTQQNMLHDFIGMDRTSLPPRLAYLARRLALAAHPEGWKLYLSNSRTSTLREFVSVPEFEPGWFEDQLYWVPSLKGEATIYLDRIEARGIDYVTHANYGPSGTTFISRPILDDPNDMDANQALALSEESMLPFMNDERDIEEDREPEHVARARAASLRSRMRCQNSFGTSM